LGREDYAYAGKTRFKMTGRLVIAKLAP